MRFFVIVLFLIMSCNTMQSQARDFSRVDATAIFYTGRFATTQDLSARIRTDFSEPEDQLRAAYTWMIHNIAYEPKEYLTYQFQYRILEERNEKLASTREEIIERTMAGKKAVCEGYALALERICEELDIHAYVVRGDVKRDVSDIGRPFNKNHMWLIALVNNRPIIMDPTWGAGKYLERFKKEPSYAFYEVRPEQFIKTHYPEVFEDTYLEEIVTKKDFSNWPLIVSEEIKIENIKPKQGTIKYKDLKKGMNFSLDIKPKGKILYTFEDGVSREANVKKEAGTLSFFINSNKRTDRLVIYDGQKPILAYLVK